ncbi:glycoside hydrolase family 78 protein [Flavobacterium undicola]|uniref:glycoside hydrolase family 78 protein n=1 Tax=Flavobacterium undicola TaxID=1932779 RepID=UPI00137752AA|nr:hypothetical protein [Flavobacterium undicola]MBA0882946.1 hypothetical protein [Flavobacterium undicola]
MMKNIFYSLIMGAVLFSCSKGGDDEESQNTAPTIPVLVSPTNNKLCIDNVISFQWNVSTDAEKNSIKYQLQVATDNQFTQIVSTKEVTDNNQSVILEKAKAYYWRVKAIDSDNLSSSYSLTYSFYTEGIAQSNHLPFLPQLVIPDYGSTVSSTAVVLKWSASDSDTADKLSYDIYLSTTNPPTTKIANTVTETSLNVNSIEIAKTYYWKIVVKDDKGGETIGQVWSFKSN